jgi:hyperosmotically inducible protein
MLQSPCQTDADPRETELGDERMNTYNRVLRMSLLTFGMLAVISGATNATAQTVTPEETVRSVRKMLERLPYYGVFDFIVFRVDRGAVYLGGYSFEGRLKMDAEGATKRASGVDEVANKIEVLPASPNDDRIRWETFYRIYTDDFLSGTHLAASSECCRTCATSGTSRACSRSGPTRSTSSSRMAERCCSESSTAQRIGKLQKCVRAR